MADESNSRDSRRVRHQDGDGALAAAPVLSAVSVATTHPIDLIEREHALQLILCNRLEETADRLPRDTDANLVHAILTLLGEGMLAHTRLEEDALFPLLRRRATADTSIADACSQLEKEHAVDSGLMVEIVEELQGLQATGRARNPEMLGYMLRGYFTGQRRHIDWENAVILPTARRLLLPDDIAALRRWMQDNDHQRFTDLLHLSVSVRAGDG